MEVAKITGVLAAELGEDVTLAKRAGLLHDIGRAAEHEDDNSYITTGMELTKKYRESSVVVNAIAAQAEETAAQSVIAELVSTAD
ncbi:HDIG domain-containing metalloprotein, partial [Mycobacterium kansasii]